MQRPGEHRKAVRHFDVPGDLHELTFSCFRRKPLLLADDHRQLLAESIDRADERYSFGLVAYVFMPEHVHLIVRPLPGSASVDALLRAIKRPMSYRAKQRLLHAGSPLLKSLTVRQRPGVNTFRFWQEGPGYDRNLSSTSAFFAAMDYVHQNPVRRGLVSTAVEWKWSSARYYAIEPPRQVEGQPVVHSISAEWIQE